jgi:O-antigen/teichoic acid export membrane protein
MAGDVLLILTVTVLLSVPHNTISSILYGISKHQLIARLRIVEALCNLALSLVLVKHLGIVGVALGTAIPQFFIMTVLLPILAGRELQLSMARYWSQIYLFPLLAALPFAGLSWFVSAEFPAQSLAVFFLQILLMLPVYAFSIAFVCFNREERTALWAMIGRFMPQKKPR